jgi:hypothetical protein
MRDLISYETTGGSDATFLAASREKEAGIAEAVPEEPPYIVWTKRRRELGFRPLNDVGKLVR